MLRLKVPLVPKKQDQYTDAEEDGPERLPQVPQGVLVPCLGRAVIGQGGVQPEELGYGDADGGEGE